MFKDLRNETVFKIPGDINGNKFNCSGLEDCTVYLLDFSTELKVTNCKRTKFYIGPVKNKVNF
jgi:hypothetical protein